MSANPLRSTRRFPGAPLRLAFCVAFAALAFACSPKEEPESEDPAVEAEGAAALVDNSGKPLMPSTESEPYPETKPNPGAAGAAETIPGRLDVKTADGRELLKIDKKALEDAQRRAEGAAAARRAAAGADPHAGLGIPPVAAAQQDVPAPEDVAAPPSDAKKTKSGIAYKFLKQGAGKEHPSANDTVSVHYSGWTTDGKNFDSSHKRGKPAEFPLSGVIAGWTEGVQLMKVGDTVRFWIPEELAYMGAPGKPAGMLVFDVELLEIKKAPAAPEHLEAPAPDAAKLESGVATKVLVAGKGQEKPALGDTVTLHYTGWLSNGKMFDSTKTRGKPITVPVERLFPGWQEGLGLMVAGETRRIWIPKDLGPRMGATDDDFELIVLDVELIEMKKAIPAPDDVAEAPSDAKQTESGLASKVLAKGTGKVHPKPENVVKVHYTGWTTDGKMFDSSVQRGEPTEFPLNRVIDGWTEGLQLMVVGEKRRFWIPQDLAYKGKPGPPAGMLVFDVELLEIKDPPAPGVPGLPPR